MLSEEFLSGGLAKSEAPMAFFAESPRTTAKRPVCSKCGAPMWLTRIQPGKPGFARRTLECPQCQNAVTEIIELEKRLAWELD
jgi:hypothetical protein